MFWSFKVGRIGYFSCGCFVVHHPIKSSEETKRQTNATIQTTKTTMQPSTEMMSYQNPPIMNEDDDAVPFITTITITQPTTTTMGHRLSKRIVIVAGTMMMLTMAGGTVWRLADTTDGGRTTTTTAARGSCRYQGWRGERARWHCISTFGSSRIVVSCGCSGLPLCSRDGDVWWGKYF